MAKKSLTAAVVLAAMAGSAQAQETFSFLSGDWLVTVKGNIVAGPAYAGASDVTVLPYPSLSARRAGAPQSFGAPDDAISFAIFDTGWLKAGPAAKFVGARNASNHRELWGLRAVDWTLEAGGFLELWPTEKWRARLEVRYGLHGHRGVVADAGMDWVERHGAWTISGGPRIKLASDRFADSYFSVTPAEAALNGRVTPFAAKGGLVSAGAAGALSYDWSERWRTTVHARWDRLAGEAGRSPITATLGSPNQFTFGATIAYTFPLRWR